MAIVTQHNFDTAQWIEFFVACFRGLLAFYRGWGRYNK